MGGEKAHVLQSKVGHDIIKTVIIIELVMVEIEKKLIYGAISPIDKQKINPSDEEESGRSDGGLSGEEFATRGVFSRHGNPYEASVDELKDSKQIADKIKAFSPTNERNTATVTNKGVSDRDRPVQATELNIRKGTATPVTVDEQPFDENMNAPQQDTAARHP